MSKRRKSIASVFIYLLVMSIVAKEAEPSISEEHGKEFVLKTQNLGLLFHKATTATLLQSKARKELKSLPEVERLLYNQCVADTRTLLQLAKCVNSVLEARQRLQHTQKDECQESNEKLNADGSLMFSLWNWINERVDCLTRGQCGDCQPPSQPTQNLTEPLKQQQKVEFLRQRHSHARFLKRKRLRIAKIYRARQKRSPPRWPSSRNECRKALPSNVQTLRNVQKYFGRLNEVIGYVYEVSKSNERFFKDVDLHVRYARSPDHTDKTREQLQQFVSQLESFDDRAVVSILSPRLLNLMPQTPLLDKESKEWLSPNMLSFQDEGMMPLPRLLQMSTSSHCETLEWLDLLMHMSGAGKMLNTMVDKFGSHMEQVETEIHPKVLDSKVHEKKFERLLSLNSAEQEREMHLHGYAQLTQQQLQIAYGPGGVHSDSPNFNFLDQISKDEDLEVALEEEIRQISQMSEQEFRQKVNEHLIRKSGNKLRRKKRDLLDQILPMTNQTQIFGYRVLQPFAFTQRIRNANIMGPYILSPYAFYIQLVAPSILNAEILSPRAFVATIFSPVILMARILSPAAFRMMLFSPVMLIVWVMVPESFSTKLFSPKLLEARIMSSDSFSFVLLSPAAGIARIGSPNAFNLLVLSPAFGTYQLFSGNRNVIQILSPGILGIDQKPLLKEPLDEARERGQLPPRAQRPPGQMPMLQTQMPFFPFLPP